MVISFFNMSNMLEIKHGAFGRVLRRMREKRGLSVSELAVKAGIFQSNLSNMEAGRIRVGPKVFVRLSREVAQSESDRLELELAFAASRIGENSEEVERVRADILMSLTQAFRDLGIDLRKLQSIEVLAFQKSLPGSSSTRIWIAYEKGAKPPPDHKEKIVAACLSEKSKRGVLLAIVRRNGKASLVQISEISLATQ